MRFPECGCEFDQTNKDYCTTCGKPVSHPKAPKVPKAFTSDANEPENKATRIGVVVTIALVAVVALIALFASRRSSGKTSSKAEDPKRGGGQQTEIAANSGDYMLPDSNTRYYSEQELNGFSNWELYIARNEIYARLGRDFKKADLTAYFGGKSWYHEQYSPDEFDSKGPQLNEFEKANANLMLAIEQSRGSEYL